VTISASNVAAISVLVFVSYYRHRAESFVTGSAAWLFVCLDFDKILPSGLSEE